MGIRKTREWQQQWCKEIKVVRVGTRLHVGWGKYNREFLLQRYSLMLMRSLVSELNNSPDIALTIDDFAAKDDREEEGVLGQLQALHMHATIYGGKLTGAFVSYPESASPRAVDSGSWIELI